jgi:hypothetical protein
MDCLLSRTGVVLGVDMLVGPPALKKIAEKVSHRSMI